jgi:hypothetical protein
MRQTMTNTHDDTLVLPPAPPLPTAAAAAINNFHIHFPQVLPISGKAVAAGASAVKQPTAKPVPAAPLSKGTASNTPVTETHTRDANGHAVTKFEDNTGASITVRGRHHGFVSVTLKDANRITTSSSDSNGFSGSTLYTVPQLGVPQQITQLESAKGNSGLSFLAGRIFNGEVSCGKETTSVSNEIIDAVTRERLQAFAKDHPALAEKLKKTQEKITVIGGVPATMEQVENTPASHKACPENMRGIGAVQAR